MVKRHEISVAARRTVLRYFAAPFIPGRASSTKIMIMSCTAVDRHSITSRSMLSQMESHLIFPSSRTGSSAHSMMASVMTAVILAPRRRSLRLPVSSARAVMEARTRSGI